MSPAIVKLLRAVAAVVVLVVLFVVVQGWVSEYRRAPEPPAQLSQPATDAEGAPEAEAGDADDKKPAATDAKAKDPESTSAKTKRVVVLVDGLNLRLEPVATGAVIRGLKADEKLVVLRKTGDWYYVRAASGTQGWISSNPSYTRTVKK